MKRDTDIQKDVNAELAWEPSVQARNIGADNKLVVAYQGQ
jgi:hypothetical protein